MKLLVLGAGAVGGYFGGRLLEAGVDVTFLVRPGRREQLKRNGLRIESELGSLQCPATTLLGEEVRPEYDFVLLTCKAYDLQSAVDALAPTMSSDCTVVPLMNGIAHFDYLDERLGPGHVIGGTCHIYVSTGRDGVIRHTGRLQRLIFGERDRSTSTRTRAFADMLSNTKIDWELSGDIQQHLWEKLVFLSSLAATTCLFRANVGEIVSAPGARDMIERVLRSTIEIATREGHPPRPAAIEFARNGLTNPAGTSTASMLHDIETGRPVESDHIIGWMLDKARQHGSDDTILALAYTHLKAYEARRLAGRLPEPSSQV